MNLKKEILTLRGETLPLSYPSQTLIEKLLAEKNTDSLQLKELPTETVANVLINCLSAYKAVDRRDIFLVNTAASYVIDETKGDFPQAILDFLSKKVLPQSVIMQHKTTDKEGKEDAPEEGLYKAFVIAQVYDALGITE